MRHATQGSPARLVLLLLASAAVACGDGENAYTFQGDQGDQYTDHATIDGNDTSVVTEIVSVGTGTNTPTGTVQGLALDDETGRPLEGVEVTVLAGGTIATATTDANGAYAFTAVPASGAELTLRYHLDGYTEVVAEVVIGVKDGDDQYETDNFTENMNVRLFPTTAGLKGTVLTASADRTQAPANGAEIVVTVTGNALVGGPSSSAAAVATFKQTAHATAGATGSFLLDGLPGGENITGSCIVLPFDADGNGVTDYDAVAITVGSGMVGGSGAEGVPGQGSVPLYPGVVTDVGPINLGQGADAVTVIYSNITGNATIQVGTPILVVFSDDLRPESLVVVITTPTGDHLPQYQLAGNTLTVETDLLEAGDHTLKLVQFRAMDGKDGTATNLGFKVFGSNLSAPQNVAAIAPDPDGDDAVNIDYSTTGLTLSFDAVAGAEGYIVFGAVTTASSFDNNANGGGNVPRHFVPLTTASDDLLRPQLPVDLGSRFNVFKDFGSDHPFLGGQAITLLVMPIDAAGRMGQLPPAQPGEPGTVTLSDNEPPSLVTLGQQGSCNNSAGTDPQTCQLIFSFSEPIALTTAFNITWSDGGLPGTPNFVSTAQPTDVSANELSTVWTLTYRVPAGADWSGDSIANMQPPRDTSSNSAVLPPATDFCGLNPENDTPDQTSQLYPRTLGCRW